jgi:glycerate kinase
VLVAPDAFKGTLEAPRVAGAIVRGLAAEGVEAVSCPVADGGEGTLDVLVAALGGEILEADAHDPLGRPVRGRYAILAGSGDGLVEVAQASGLTLVGEHERDAERASSAGTGELIVAARRRGARRILVAAGGSATTDGGAGALGAIRRAGGLGATGLTVLCDVRTPFEHAAALFAPQKGAGPEAVSRLRTRLGRLARSWPRDPRGVPMTGAAGGLAGGLWAVLGARLVGGAPFVLGALGFDGRLRGARAVVTGEGRLDAATLDGKLVAEVAVRARQMGVPAHAIVGQAALDPFEARILDLQHILEAGSEAELARAGRQLAGRL